PGSDQIDQVSDPRLVSCVAQNPLRFIKKRPDDANDLDVVENLEASGVRFWSVYSRDFRMMAVLHSTSYLDTNKSVPTFLAAIFPSMRLRSEEHTSELQSL